MEIVDVLAGEDKITGVCQEKTKDEGAGQPQIIVRRGEVPKHAVRAGQAQHRHHDYDVLHHAADLKRIAPCGHQICANYAGQVQDWIDAVCDYDASPGTLEAAVQFFRGVPEFYCRQAVDDIGKRAKYDNQHQDELHAGKIGAKDTHQPHCQRNRIDAVDCLALVVLEMPQQTMVHVALVCLAQAFHQCRHPLHKRHLRCLLLVSFRCVKGICRRGCHPDYASPHGQ